MTLNEASRNELAAALGTLYNSGTLEIRTSGGTTLLATITLPNPAFGSPSSGAVAKSGTWTATAVASGVARLGRFISSDTNKTMEVTIAESAAEMIIDDEDVVNGGTVTVSTFTITQPAS
jgi:hypothetical protein